MRPRTPLTLPKVQRCGNITILTFIPDAIRDVENVIARELFGLTDGTGDRHLLLDFTNVEYLNSMELGTLVTLHKQVEATGGRLTLFNLSAQVFELFAVTRLDTVLGICREGVVPSSAILSPETTAVPEPRPR
jgi:anti-sigma B factor antagonist